MRPLWERSDWTWCGFLDVSLLHICCQSSSFSVGALQPHSKYKQTTTSIFMTSLSQKWHYCCYSCHLQTRKFTINTIISDLTKKIRAEHWGLGCKHSLRFCFISVLQQICRWSNNNWANEQNEIVDISENRVKSSEIWGRIEVEPLLHRIERSQLRWFGHLVMMPSGHLPFSSCFKHVRLGGDPILHIHHGK